MRVELSKHVLNDQTGGAMDRSQVQRIVSQVAASYVSRELDRIWLDRLMATPLGRRLKGLSRTEQRAFELIAYLSSAYVVHRDPNPSALRAFLNTILSDIPPELAKRMMAQDDPPSSQTALLLLEHLDDEELTTLSERPQGENRVSTEPSAAMKIREKIEKSRASMRENRKIIGRRGQN